MDRQDKAMLRIVAWVMLYLGACAFSDSAPWLLSAARLTMLGVLLLEGVVWLYRRIRLNRANMRR